jgi:hypothetical protein
MLLQELNGARAIILGRKVPGRRKIAGHVARIDAEQDRERDLAGLPIDDRC